MADNTNDAAMADAANIEQVEQAEQHETDWKAEARKWEKRARDNQLAADELEKLASLTELKESHATELKKAQAEAEKATAELEALKAEKAITSRALELGESSGIPVSMLMHCASVEAMDEFAKEWAAYHENAPQAVHSAPMAKPQRLVKESGVAKSGVINTLADYIEIAANK